MTSDQTRKTHWPPMAQGDGRTIAFTKKGEAMARAIKLSGMAGVAARIDREYLALLEKK